MKNKKLYQKIISIFLSVTILCSLSLTASASTPESTSLNGVNSTSASLLWKAAFKVIPWVLVRLDDSTFDRDPTIKEGGNWVATSSGDVSFGNGQSDVIRAKFTNNISVSHNRLDVFAQTSVTGWLEKISIFIEDSSGNQVEGGQVTHNQHILTDSNLDLDTYTAYFVYNKNRKWDCWVYRYDFTADYSRSNDTIESYNKAYHDTGLVYDPYENKSYIIPSDSGIEDKISTYSNNSKAELTAQDLVNEFHDDKLNCSVNRMKNYDINDIIYVTDVVNGLEYDSSKNITTLYFGNTTDGTFSWPFSGDLREQISVNDELTFRFGVVEEYEANGYSFETLDYFLESYDLLKDNSAANIQNYLVW